MDTERVLKLLLEEEKVQVPLCPWEKRQVALPYPVAIESADRREILSSKETRMICPTQNPGAEDQ